MRKIIKLFFLLIFVQSINAQVMQIVIDKWAIEQSGKNATNALMYRGLKRAVYYKPMETHTKAQVDYMAIYQLTEETLYYHLTNINTALKEGKMMLNTTYYFNKIIADAQELMELTKNHPEFAFIGTETNKYFVSKSIQIMNEISGVVTNKKLLLDYKDRDDALKQIYTDIKLLHGVIASRKMMIKTAIRLGAIGYYTPLKEYINLDKSLMDNVMNRIKLLTE